MDLCIDTIFFFFFFLRGGGGVQTVPVISWVLYLHVYLFTSNRSMVDSEPCCFVRMLIWVCDVCKDIL